MAIAVNNQPYKSGDSSRVYEAARVAPTLFPIVFAAVVGRLMRNFALWRAERGERLGLIEQLHGSQNLVSALERAYLLPGLGLASVAVVLIWLTSPLGGQSSSRVLRPDGRADAITGTADVYYYNSSATPEEGGYGLTGSLTAASAAYSMNGVLVASLLSILRVKGQDLWGHVKVPFLESALAYSQNKMTNGWYDTVGFDESNSNKTGADDTPYSTLTGIITGITVPDVLSNFTMQTTYYNMTCEKPNTFDDADAFAQWAGTLYYHTNISDFFGDVDYTNFKFGRTFMVDTNWVGPVNESSTFDSPYGTAETPFNLIYASRWTGLNVTAFNCSLGYTHLELNIMNDALGSHVRGVRPTTTPEIYANYLPFWSTNIAVSYVQGLINWIESAVPLTGPYQTSPVDVYITGSDTPFSYEASTTDPDAETGLFPTSDPGVVARRLTSILNTGWQTSFLLGAITKSPSTNATQWAEATVPNYFGNDGTGVGFSATRAKAVTETQIRLNSVNKAWVIITIAVSCLLLVCGVSSLVIKYKTYSPDVLGFVSSMTRDNPNFERVPGSDQMDGLGYAKKLSNVRVQLEVNSPMHGNDDDEARITLRNLGHAR